jgi:hypothetical protein
VVKNDDLISLKSLKNLAEYTDRRTHIQRDRQQRQLITSVPSELVT